MGPVLLLNVGVIVLLVRPASRKLDCGMGLPAEVQQVIVDELLPVVRVDSPQPEGQSVLDVQYPIEYPGAAFSHDRHPFRPACLYVGRVQGPNKTPVEAVAAMSHGVNLQETRQPDIPVRGPNRDHALKQRSRPGPAIEAFLEPVFMDFQSVLHLSSTYGFKLPFNFRCDS